MTTAAIELLRPSGRRTPCKVLSACRGWRRVTFVKYFSLSSLSQFIYNCYVVLRLILVTILLRGAPWVSSNYYTGLATWLNK